MLRISLTRYQSLKHLQKSFQHAPKNLKIKKSAPLAYSLSSIIAPFATHQIHTSKRIHQNSAVYSSKNSDEKKKQKSENEESEVEFSIADLWQILKKHQGKFILSILCAIAAAYFNIQIPITLGHLIDKVSTFLNSTDPMPFSEFFKIIETPVKKLLQFYSLQAISTLGLVSSLFNLGEAVACDLRSQLFSKIVNYEMAYFDQKRSMDLIQTIDSDVQDFKHSFKKILSNSIKASTQILGCAASLYTLSPELTQAMGLGLPVMVLTGRLLSSGLRKLSRKSRQDNAEAAAYAGENIEQIKTIKIFSAEEAVSSKYDQKLSDIQNSNYKFGLGLAGFQAISNLGLNSIVGLTIAYGGWLLNNNKLSGGDLMAFVSASQMIQRSLASLSQIAADYIKLTGAGTRIKEVESHIVEKKYLQGETTLKYFQLLGDLNFVNVGFSYPTRNDSKVLEKVNFSLRGSEKVALVGNTGSGKSTIGSLLLRLYEPSNGKIFMDGAPLSSYDPHWLRSKVIAVVSQEPTLFNMSILENIRFGNPDATDDEVLDAAEKANCLEFISKLPQGFKTNVGERGSQLSGGQKQRVAIARALIKNPSILILDEATSALDAASEKLVQEAIDNACGGKTVIIIAHRLSTIKNADKIVVLDNGVVNQIGTHDELMKKGGKYRSLVETQLEN